MISTIAADRRSRRSVRLQWVRKYPPNEPERKATPATPVVTAIRIPGQEPSMMREGEYTNIKGKMKPGIPSRKARNPVRKGSDLAIPAAAYAASAKGGVMLEMTPK